MIHISTRLDPVEEELLDGAAFHAVVEEDPASVLIFDIETTGLSADSSFVFLIGCILFEEGHWILHQYMIRFVQEERQLLLAFFEQAKRAKILIHFNGNHFDIPFLEKRAASIGVDSPLLGLASLDLYLRYKPLKNLLGLRHMNQSALEAFTGWDRTDQLDGKDMIGKYWSYSVNNDPSIERQILGHNRDDLKGMLRVFQMEGYLSLLRGEILPDIRAEETYGRALFTLAFTSLMPLPHPLTIEKEIFLKSGPSIKPTSPPAKYSLQVEENQGSIGVPIFTGRLNSYLKDYKNYYYLPMEKKVIHKSVASFVDKEYKEHATPQNCYVEKSGRFLFQPEKLFTPAFQEDYDSQALFFFYENSFSAKKEDLYVYVQALLKDIFQK